MMYRYRYPAVPPPPEPTAAAWEDSFRIVYPPLPKTLAPGSYTVQVTGVRQEGNTLHVSMTAPQPVSKGV